MKLKLYTHQIKSLCWMRRRETRQLEEKDFLEVTLTTTADDSLDNHQPPLVRPRVLLPQDDGDGHRAVTGGASVLLRPRQYYGTDTPVRVVPLVRYGP